MADLGTIQVTLDKIYNEIVNNPKRRRNINSGNTTNNNQTSNVKDFEEYVRTGISSIDRITSSIDNTKDSIETFGDFLGKGGGALGRFGEIIKANSNALTAFRGVIDGIITYWGYSTQIQNLKATSNSAAAKRQIQENVLQFNRDSQLLNVNTQDFINDINYAGDFALKQLELSGNIMLQSLKIITQNQVKATEIAVGPIINGINETAYKAAEYAIERKKDLKLLDIEAKKAGKELELFSSLKGKEYEMQRNVFQRERESANTEYKRQSLTNSLEGAIETRDLAAEVKGKELLRGFETGATIGGAAGMGLGGPWGAALGGVVGSVGGGIAGFDEALNDNTWKNSYNFGKDKTNDMLNVLQNNNKFSNQKYNFIGNERLLSANEKWVNNTLGKLGFEPNSQESEIMLKTEVDKFSNDIHMIAEGNKILTQSVKDINISKLTKQNELQQKNLDINTEAAKTLAEMEKGEEMNWLKLAQETEKWLDKFDKTTNNLGKSFGYTNRKQLDDFQQSMFVAGEAAEKFGKTYEEAVKYQQQFIENTGRNRMFSKSDYGQMMALGEYLGDEGLATSYASEMEIFNTGVADSVDMLDEALQDVNRMGLNGRKYTKTLVDNLKLAQKYTFKEGTKGLMRMAKWAENTRFNLASLGGMIEKIQEGGLENIITMGAQFQVLGGHSAMNADPIAMMYEAFADPEALMKRYQDMTIGYGQIDKETGETKFSVNEMMMMRQLAKIQGRSVEEVENEVRARNKKEVVAKQLNGNFNEEEQAFISNNATYNKKTEQFQVKVKDESGNYVERNVNELTTEDIEKLMPEKHNERMEDYMATVVDYLAMLTGETNRQQREMGQANYGVRQENYKERLEISRKNFEENFDMFVGKSQEYMQFMTQEYSGYMDLFKKGNEQVNNEMKNLEEKTNAIASVLSETSEIVKDINNFLEENNEKLKKTIDEHNKLREIEFDNNYGLNTSQIEAEKEKEKKIKQVSEVYKDKNEGYFSNIAKGQRLASARERESTAISKYNSEMGKTGSSLWYRINSVGESTLGRVAQFIGNVFGVDASSVDDFFHDGIISNNNKPIISEASNITKVQDGTSFVKSDKRDSALFAKTGGPFDKLFNGIFGKIGETYDLLSGKTRNKVSPIEIMYEAFSDPKTLIKRYSQYNKAQGISPMELPNRERSFGGSYIENNVGGNVIRFETLKIQIEGSLELKSNGQSVDVIGELRNNPMLVRNLSRMLTEHVTAAFNGGRGKTNLAIGSV